MINLDKPSVYLTNLGKYTEGELVGKWINVPISIQDFNQELKNIGVDGVLYEEFFFTDWENISNIGEYSSIEEVNSIAKANLTINEILKEKTDEATCSEDYKFIQETLYDYFKGILEDDDTEDDEAMNELRSLLIFTGSHGELTLTPLEEFGYYLLEEHNYLDYNNLDPETQSYIDVEKFARDHSMGELVLDCKKYGKYNDISVIIAKI